ncbi:hypothetical protein L2E82_11366 [Cichorium intybus]|uniref:Uncharacterized protein n=1 Tax=Cichorium intybus TaxID=13427 RepID=A0ACB9GE64_CICIN|nr:hypothetical protein L2E82_11366 [Cichorium intybus]
MSTSVYVTNFPKEWNAQILWAKCQEFGIVVDVKDVKGLVSKMQGTWYGNYHLFANVAYGRNETGINRSSLVFGVANKEKSNAPEQTQQDSESVIKMQDHPVATSFASVLKRQPSATIPIKKQHEVGGKLDVVVMEKQDAILIPDAGYDCFG